MANSKAGKKLETGGGRYTPIGKYEEDKNYRPIVEKQFTAKFNGNEKEIKLTIKIVAKSGMAYAGVFGYVGKGGEICKLGIAKGSYISASASGSTNYIGGIAGRASGKISGCYNIGEVSGDSAGGIAGNASSTVTGCYNTGEVSGESNIGGIAGYAEGTTTISGCYNTGEVSGESNIGGIAGYAYGTITGCYNTGEVNGGSNIGGIAGCAPSGTTISGCYNTGEVNGGSNIGGIAGYAPYGTITITGCYYLVGCAEEAVGRRGKNVEIKDVVALFAADLRAESLVEKLNKATKEAVEALKSEVLKETKEALQLSAAPTTLDEAKQKLEEKLKTETSMELQNLLAKIEHIKALPADGKVFVYAFGRYPALWWEKVPSIELDLGRTRSSIGGDAGFYKASNGVVTFKVEPNPGYKISEIITSGSRIIKPGDAVKALPECVKVNFEKV